MEVAIHIPFLKMRNLHENFESYKMDHSRMITKRFHLEASLCFTKSCHQKIDPDDVLFSEETTNQTGKKSWFQIINV